MASGFPVQSSIVVMGDGTGTDYLYFNTNAQKGAGYCYSYDGGKTGSKVWGTTGDTYALGGMAIDNGYAVFGNDYNHLYVVHLSPMTTMVSSWSSTYSGLISVVSHPLRLMAMMFTP